jgi:hypothetical protein
MSEREKGLKRTLSSGLASLSMLSRINVTRSVILSYTSVSILLLTPTPSFGPTPTSSASISVGCPPAYALLQNVL